MTQFVNNDVSSGAVVFASDHNTQGSLIAAVLNGGIDNANIATNAAIDGSKIADNSIPSSKFLAGSEGWLPVSSTFSVSSGYNKSNKEYDLTSSADLTAVLSPGMRLKVSRGTTPPTQCTDLELGSSQYAAKASPSGVVFTDDFTVEAWVKLESYGTAMGILSRRNSSNGWEVYLTVNGQVGIAGINSSAADIGVSNQSLPLGQWVHIAATLDMSASASTIYINGASVPVTYTNGAATALVQASVDLALGATNSSFYLDGKLADIRLWNTVRTQTQVRDNMNIQLAGNESGLIAYYKLNGDFNDSTSNANNLTGQNSAVATNVDNPMSSTEYGIVTKVTASTVTVFTGTDYNIPNGTLSNPYYSTQSVPYGFPASRGKWQVKTILKSQFSASVSTANTWQNPASAKMNIPTGDWDVDYGVHLLVTHAGSTFLFGRVSLSTANNAESNPELTSVGMTINSSLTEIDAFVARRKTISNTSATDYYLIATAGSNSSTVYYNTAANGAASTVTATCAYL